VNDLRREPIKKQKSVRKQSGKSRIAISSSSGVVEFRSPSEFPDDVFDSALGLSEIISNGYSTKLLQGRRVTVRYTDAKLNNGNTRYYADGVVTATKKLVTMVKLKIKFDEYSYEQEHNYTLKSANTDIVYGIGIYRVGLARGLQLRQNFAALLRGRNVPLWGSQ
jgi:hypothetical protein